MVPYDPHTPNHQADRNGKGLTEFEQQIINSFQNRRAIFDAKLRSSGREKETYTCPSCGYPTLPERGQYDICEICDWEDDGQDDNEANEVYGGPNGELSLTESRLLIGRQLSELAASLGGSIVTDLGKFDLILQHHRARMQKLNDKMSSDTGINDKSRQEWSKARKMIRRDLIE
jgi:hypothetical protein